MVRGQWAHFGKDAEVTPLLFFEGHPGIFNDHRETGPRFYVSSEGRLSFSRPAHLRPSLAPICSPLVGSGLKTRCVMVNRWANAEERIKM